MFSFKNAFSSAPSGHSVEPLTLGVNEITTFSTGTYLAGNITPASADISFRQGGQGLNVGTVNGTDFFIGLLGDTYIPAGGQGLVTFPAGSVTITNWTGAIPDNIVTQVDVVSRSDGSLTPNTTLMFVDPTPPEPPVIESFSRNPATGLLSLSFKSSASKTYSIFGGESLNNIASWSEISTTDITDNGGSASFTYTPAGSPLKYFLQVRED
ncbi:hypothetical protein [Haloferula sp.]|uniref:hypothetical protein n=1 Tax=Haloferula sp. TaxID=2497595 RepID=UPI00329CEFB0